MPWIRRVLPIIFVVLAALASALPSPGKAGPLADEKSVTADAMLDAYFGSRTPSAIACCLDPPLIVVQVFALQARILGLRLKIANLRSTRALTVRRLAYWRNLQALQEAIRSGVDISEQRIAEVRAEAAALGEAFFGDDVAGGVIASLSERSEALTGEIEAAEAELQGLEGQSVAPNTPGNLIQWAPLQSAPGRAAPDVFGIGEAQTRQLSQVGSQMRHTSMGVRSDGTEHRRSPVRVVTGASHVDFDQDAAVARAGDVTTVWSGLHAAISDAMAVGLYGIYRHGDVRSSTVGSSLDSESYGIGAYLVHKFAGGVTGALSFEYNSGDHDITAAGATGSFDTDDVTIQAEVTNRYYLPPDKAARLGITDPLWIEPLATLSYTHISRDGYIDSAATAVPSGSLERARFTFGPRVGALILGDGDRVNLVQPYISLQGVWDFVNEGDFTLAPGTIIETPDIGGMVGTGVVVSFMNNAAISLSGHHAFFEDEFNSWSISGGVTIPLEALGVFGPHNAGLISLQLDNTENVSSASLEVSLPLN